MVAHQRICFNGLSLNYERELIDVTTTIEPDPAWRFVDNCGHKHKWHITDCGESFIRSCVVERYVAGYYEDGEPDARYRYLCEQCGEEISPKWRVPTFRSYVCGLMSADISGVPVT